MGKLWGLKPRMALWIYKMVVRPIVAYASLIWSKAIHSEEARKSLEKFQYFALNTLGYFRKNTPANALEVITDTMPLDLFIMHDTLCSYIRTRGHEKFTEDKMHTTQPKLKGHRQVAKEFAIKIGADHLLEEEIDDMQTVFNWNKAYKVDKESYNKSNKNRGTPTLTADVNIYTDGSRFGPYRCGAGMSVWKAHDQNNVRTERPLPGHDRTAVHLEDNTIMLCEVFGAGMGANFLRDNHEEFAIKSATINIDSQACLKALASNQIKSKTVLASVLRLNEAAKFLPGEVTLRWVKAHLDGTEFRGNNFADAAARSGAIAEDVEALLEPQDIPLRPLSSIKYEILQLLRKQWNTRWTQNTNKDAGSVQTKLWFPELNSKKSFQLMHQRNRFDFSILVQAITGFNHLSYHNAKIDKSENTSRRCTICKKSVLSGEVMTTRHLFTECEALGLLRLRNFGTHEPVISQLPISQVTRFLTEANDIIPWLPKGYKP